MIHLRTRSMSEETRHKLQELSEFLRHSVPQRLFHMETYFFDVDNKEPLAGVNLSTAKDMKNLDRRCGTAACALGWLAIMDMERGCTKSYIEYVDVMEKYNLEPGLLGDGVWAYMFDPDWPNDPVAAADRIDNILKAEANKRYSVLTTVEPHEFIHTPE